MSTMQIRIGTEREMSVPAEVAYRVLADYREHHPAILPFAFTNYVLEEGGTGAGTIIRFDLKAGGRVTHHRSRIDEPDPGRVLTETDLGTGAVTRFDVTPLISGCVVRITTIFDASPGPMGWMERMLAPRMLRRVYDEELENLERHAAALATPAADLVPA
ncbi:MAG TPA: SRPBCC family protein [Thermomicrobiales bacterium]|nr:SRPBCC family protein [Thermomicrobiales bacterium]